MKQFIKIRPINKILARGVWIEAAEAFDCEEANKVYDLDAYLAPFTPQGMHIVDWAASLDEIISNEY